MSDKHRDRRLTWSTVAFGLCWSFLGIMALGRVNEASLELDTAVAAQEGLLAQAAVSSEGPALRSVHWVARLTGEATQAEAQAIILLALVAILGPILTVLQVLGQRASPEAEEPIRWGYRSPRPVPPPTSSAGSFGAIQKPSLSGAVSATSLEYSAALNRIL